MPSGGGVGRGRRGRPREEAAEALILDAALGLFAAGGLAAASFEQIAERAGVSRGTLYRRWRSREDVLVAALQRARAAGEAGAEDWATRPVTEVVALFEQLTVAALLDGQSLRLLRQVFALETGNPIKQAYWSTVVQPRRELFSRMITTARARRELPPGAAPDLLQDQLAGALSYRALMQPEPLDEASARRYVHDLLVSLGLLG